MLPKNISPALSWILCILGCIVFAGLKWQDLSLPMYWDEIGVYGPGILYMLDHGISLLPSGLDPELSRGHPLFFYFLFATWVKLLGYSLFKLHIFALCISISLFVSVFYIARKLTSELPSLIMTFWLMAQGAVFAQSSLALPEMLLSLEILWALYFFYQKKHLLYILAAALALLSKESALVLPIACVCWQLWLFIQKKERNIGKGIIISAIPLLSYLIFLFIQKQTHGWYFFPYHLELVNLDTAEILKKFTDYLVWMFWDQGRFAMSLLTVGIMGIIFYKKTLFQHSILSLLVIFGGGFLAFGALNVYMDRYLMTLFPLLAIGVSFLLDKVNIGKVEASSLRPNFLLKIGIGLCLIMSSLLNMSQEAFRFDVDINYRDYVSVQKEATEYLETQIPPQESFLANFPLFNGFQDPRFGFAKDTFHNTAWVVPNDSMKYRALLVPPSFANALPKDGELIKVFEKGFSKVEVYLKD